jgi:hypothetical protein
MSVLDVDVVEAVHWLHALLLRIGIKVVLHGNDMEEALVAVVRH